MKVPQWSGISNRIEWIVWSTAALLLGVPALFLRFYNLAQPLLEPHPARQSMTGLTVQLFAQGKASFFRYHYPDPAISNLVYEFPLYQWLASLPMGLGFSLEVASRGTSLAFFFLGFFVFIKLLERALDRRTAVWAGLFYVLSPFSIIFSNACLPDTFGTALLWTALLFTWIYLHEERPDLQKHLLAGITLAGSLAALAKPNVWGFPVLVLGAVVLYQEVVRKRFSNRLTLPLLASYVFQLILALAWTKWAMSVRGEGGGVPQPGWYFGDLSMRLDWTYWQPNVSVVVRQILNYWMVPLYLLGLFTPFGAVAFSIVFLHLIVFFAVHFGHDYYFISGTPWLVATAAVGWVRVWRLPVPLRSVLFVGVGVLFTYRLAKIEYAVGTIFHDYWPRASPALDIRDLTRPEEVIVIDTPWNKLHPYLLYSQRTLVLWDEWKKTPERFAHLDPSAFYFAQSHSPGSTRFTDFPSFWLDRGQRGTLLWRVQGSQAQAFAPFQHVGVGMVEGGGAWQEVVDLCESPRSHWVGAWPGNAEQLLLELRDGTKVVLPRRSTLSLPKSERWGCRYRLSFKSP